MSALSHQREVGGPINSIIPFLTDNSRIFYFFWNYATPPRFERKLSRQLRNLLHEIQYFFCYFIVGCHRLPFYVNLQVKSPPLLHRKRSED